MQIAYIKELYELMRQDAKVVSILSDSGTEYDVMMASEMPRQCYNVGISEQDQVGVAAGMAMGGKLPFVYTTGAFLAYRSHEFIRNDVCYQNLNVKIVGMGSGLAWRTLGPSHHATEDLAALRALPNLTLLSPATPLETAACTRLAYEHAGPVYLRIGMSGEREFYDGAPAVRVGGSAQLTQGRDAALLCTGSVLAEAMAAEELLRREGVHASVLDLYSVKPLDETAVLAAARTCGALLTVEEHSVFGGLGGAVAEALAEAGVSVPFRRIGLRDCFARGYGTLSEVREANGLDGPSIARRVLALLGGKEDPHE